MRIGRRGAIFGFAVVLVASSRVATAQQQAVEAPIEATVQATQTTPAGERQNPWAERPVCASMFLKADWKLTPKQRVCDWIHNRMFSTSALVGAAWSAGYSQLTDSESERGDSFGTRFSRKFAQHAFKSTGSYLGGLVFREDPRASPPYLVMRTTPRARGFWKRTAHAIGRNFVSYRCDAACTKEEDIRRVFAWSRVTGSFASGFASELWNRDEPDSHRRALRGVASAYGSTFANQIFSEFKPELSAFAGKAFTKIFGVR